MDGPLVTVRGWPDNGPWMREFVRLLKGVKSDRARRDPTDLATESSGP